jgi:hypothetical protein
MLPRIRQNLIISQNQDYLINNCLIKLIKTKRFEQLEII